MAQTIDNPVADSGQHYASLYHRLKFILGPRFVERFPAWHRFALNSGMYLTVHPDLPVHHVRLKDIVFVLLGFMLDPNEPTADDTAILTGLIQQFDNCANIFSQTARFGGRWALIIDDRSRFMVFNDAIGSRRVFFTDLRLTKELWCCSEPSLLADILDLKVDEDAAGYLAAAAKIDPEYWWPGESTLYKEVRHLLPNHYLDLSSGKTRRYSPDRGPSTLPLAVVVQRCSFLLRGLLASAANRFNLVVTLTAGWDSRLVLAASKDIRHRLSYMTLRKAGEPDDDPDITVASKIASKLQLRHQVVSAHETVDGNFRNFFTKHSMPAHDVWLLDAQGLLDFYKLDKVVVTGSASETARCFYKRLPRYLKWKMTGDYLASLTSMKHPFAVAQFNSWLVGVPRKKIVDSLDLFYWEQRAGNWLAMCQAEFDTAWSENFTPFNCRLLLESMLSAQQIYRQPPNHILYAKLISTLWPEVLGEPINPHKEKTEPSYAQDMREHMWMIRCLFFPNLHRNSPLIRSLTGRLPWTTRR